MFKVFAVIGEKNARKSSLLRSLTGIGNNRKALDIATGTGKSLRVWCRASSPQEGNKCLPAREFIAQIQQEAKGCDAVAIALRRNPHKGCPDAQTYLDQMQGKGWTIAHLVLLGPDACEAGWHKAWKNKTLFPNSTDLPTNAMAADVRRAWGWM